MQLLQDKLQSKNCSFLFGDINLILYFYYMNKDLYAKLVKEENNLLLRLKHVRDLKKLYENKDVLSTVKPTVYDVVLNAIKELGKCDVKQIGDKLGKSTKTIDNICRSLVKDNKIKVIKEGKKSVYNVKE